ncbi:nuclear transport factor 2 family protein [Sediminicola luteus]|uniref:DUF4440 domain-containing protein n=1 Tax=Sediminicola luteus TaxID=319238 RepID=A0A2A4GF46_9FLAO|nr:nuclear transport factor 2 family protein [Sediminicola luteus]PCE66600.1 hypothetical protein B7P33_04705 [Sediminicola luteus]
MTVNKSEILDLENRLLQAMKTQNLAEMNALLHEDLLFVIPTGQIMSKAMELENITSGRVQLQSVSVSDHKIVCLGDTALVSVKMLLKGTFADHPIDGEYRYFRTWKLFGTDWKLIGGSGMAL